jgi:maltokinase
VTFTAKWRLDDRHAIIVTRSGTALRLAPSVLDQGGWRRAVPGDGTAAAFLAALDGDAPPGFRLQHFAPDAIPTSGPPGARPPAARPATVPGRAERGFTVDQTNESVVVDEQRVVKWLLSPEDRPHPAPPLLAHLRQVGFTRTPAPYAALWWSPEPAAQEALLAIVAGYLPDAQDGWDWCVDDLLAEWQSGKPASFPADLGILAADLHVALATSSAVFPAPVSTTTWTRTAADVIETALAITPGADGEWLRDLEETLRNDAAVAAQVTPVMRIHGDLHVGQILRWRDGLAVTDFDGNPAVDEVQPLQPAARDVAQLLTSLEHVAQIADKRAGYQQTSAALAFAARARHDCLSAYQSRLAERGMSHLLDERLLKPFAVEQECRELIYAARFLPRWTYAPMNVLRSWYCGL